MGQQTWLSATLRAGVDRGHDGVTTQVGDQGLRLVARSGAV